MPPTAALPKSELERLLVRALALCVHPYAAWRTKSTRSRVLVLCTYAVASYALVLTVLLSLQKP
jgi:hypothetical protein